MAKDTMIYIPLEYGDDLRPGDIVTRRGRDRWEVLDSDGHQVDLKCVRGSWWCKKGDEERNLIDKYSLCLGGA